jgi:hypothetical protein
MSVKKEAISILTQTDSLNVTIKTLQNIKNKYTFINHMNGTLCLINSCLFKRIFSELDKIGENRDLERMLLELCKMIDQPFDDKNL